MKLNIGLQEQGRKKLGEGLYHVLADMYMLYLKTQNFHWNVQGSNFYALHLLFEKQYRELAEAIDEVAERLQALGFFVEASFTGFQKEACLKEEKKAVPAHRMLEQLLRDHEIVIRCLRELCNLAEQQNDGATVDLIGKRLGAHEKAAWMLRAQV